MCMSYNVFFCCKSFSESLFFSLHFFWLCYFRSIFSESKIYKCVNDQWMNKSIILARHLMQNEILFFFKFNFLLDKMLRHATKFFITLLPLSSYEQFFLWFLPFFFCFVNANVCFLLVCVFFSSLGIELNTLDWPMISISQRTLNFFFFKILTLWLKLRSTQQ